MPHLFVSGDPAAVRERRPEAVVLGKPFREASLVAAITRALGATTV